MADTGTRSWHSTLGWGLASPDGSTFTDAQGVSHRILTGTRSWHPTLGGGWISPDRQVFTDLRGVSHEVKYSDDNRVGPQKSVHPALGPGLIFGRVFIDLKGHVHEVKYSPDQPRDDHGRFGSGGVAANPVTPGGRLDPEYDANLHETALRGRYIPVSFMQKVNAGLPDGKKMAPEQIAAWNSEGWVQTIDDGNRGPSKQLMAIQQAVTEKFGMPSYLPDPTKEPLSYDAPGLGGSSWEDTRAQARAMVDASYADTQARFAHAGADSVVLERGISMNTPLIPGSVGELQVHSNPASSWTSNASWASEFAHDYGHVGDRYGYVLTAKVPVTNILGDGLLGAFGGAGMSEHVVLGGNLSVHAKEVMGGKAAAEAGLVDVDADNLNRRWLNHVAKAPDRSLVVDDESQPSKAFHPTLGWGTKMGGLFIDGAGRIHEIKYSDDQPRDDHGRWGAAASAVDMAHSVRSGMEPDFPSERHSYPQTGTPGGFATHEQQYTVGVGPHAEKITATNIGTYDADGKLVGTFSIQTTGQDAGAFKISVREDSQRQGIGTRLLQEAERQGVDFSKVMAANHFTGSGRALLRAYIQGKLDGAKSAEPGQKYSPDQPRDDHGRFGSGGGEGDVAAAAAEAAPSGGFTVHPYRATTPVTGYQVGGLIKPEEFPDGQAILDDHERLAETIEQHVLAHSDIYKAGGGIYVGGWLDGNGALVLEPSERIVGRAAAVAAGQARNQEGIWDNHAGANGKDGFIGTGGTGEFTPKGVRGSDPGQLRRASERGADGDRQEARDGDAEGAQEGLKYSADQPRDDHGRFGSGGSGFPTGEDLTAKVASTVAFYDRSVGLAVARAPVLLALPGADARAVKNAVVTKLATDTGLSYGRANQMIKTWSHSASDTEPDSVALQMAAAAKFGVDPGAYLQAKADYMNGGYKDALAAGPPSPRSDVDSAGRLVGPVPTWTQSILEQAPALHAFDDAVTMSQKMEPTTTFRVPAAYFVPTATGGLPFPGYGRTSYGPGSGFTQQVLSNGDVQFTRDNVASAAPADPRNPQSPDATPFSQRMSDATKVVGATYANTQATLAANDISEMTVFRGMNWNSDEVVPEPLREMALGMAGYAAATKDITVQLNPLSSFSVNSETARVFGGGSRSCVLGVRVPASRVFSLSSTGPGSLSEGEVIVLGGPTEMVGGKNAFAGAPLTQSEFSIHN